MALQFGGPIGPFRDNVQQRDVPVIVMGTCEYQSSNPPNPQLDGWIQGQLLGAIRNVIGEKMATGQLTFRHLGMGQIAFVMPEIVAASGLAQQGVHIGNLTMQFGIDGHPPAGSAPQQQAMQPQQPQYDVEARIDVGGLRINASTDKGLDTAGLQTQLKDKATSQIMWWGIGCGILLLVGIFIAGLGLYIWRTAATSMSSTGPARGRGLEVGRQERVLVRRKRLDHDHGREGEPLGHGDHRGRQLQLEPRERRHHGAHRDRGGGQREGHRHRRQPQRIEARRSGRRALEGHAHGHEGHGQDAGERGREDHGAVTHGHGLPIR